MERIALAYSGDLDTTIAIPWLRDKYHAAIIAVTVDVGQGGELEAVRNRALAAGAARAHVLDAREEFASLYVLRALKADAAGDQPVALTRSLGRALIVGKLMEVAGIEQAPAIAHGCTEGSERFDLTARALNASVRSIAPSLDRGMTRSEEVENARARGIPVPATAEGPYRTDVNLWGRSIAGGVLDDPWAEAPEDVYTLTKPAALCPDVAAYVEVSFERGVPAAINGVEMPLLDLMASLATIAGAHGVGRVDAAANRDAAGRRMVYEAPAAVVLHQAHAELQRMVTTREADRFSHIVGLQYRDVVQDGQWFTPLREALDACVQTVQERVTGTIRLKLFKGGSTIVGRRSPHAVEARGLSGESSGTAGRPGAAPRKSPGPVGPSPVVTR